MKMFSLGLDMAAVSFVAALRFDERRHAKAQFSNDRRGFEQLGRWLKTHAVGLVRAGIECTNTYGQALAYWLHAQGHEVYLLNPCYTSYYAKARGQRNKTDPADAATISDYVALHKLTPWSPPSQEQAALSALTRTRDDLVSQRKQLANQLRTAHPIAQPHLQALLKSVDQQIKAIEQDMRKLISEHESLHSKVRRVMTIKGIGWLTAAIVIAELPLIDENTDARTICAWAGLIPSRWQSGNDERPTRISKRGNKHLRQALFMPALVARKHNPLLAAFADRLAENGKRPAAIVGAIAHKMLRIVVGLLKSNTDFDPNWSFSKT